MVTFREPKTWRKSAGVKATDLNRELRDQIRRLQLEVTILQTSTGGSVDPGTILPFLGDTITIPNGWLLCDGRQVAKATYPDLYARIGVAYGSETTLLFTLPDFRGKMLRGNPVAVPQQILGRGNASGASSPRSDTLNSNMSFVGNASNDAFIGNAGSHSHGFNFAHSHNHNHNHNTAYNNDNHSHSYANHAHNASGPTATRNNGVGNVNPVAQGTHNHSPFPGGAGNSLGEGHAHNWVSGGTSVNVTSATGNLTSNSESDHNHGANSRDHTHTLTHTHTIDTTPAFIETNFLVKT